MSTSDRRGYLTTEFWLTLVAQLAGLFALATGADVSGEGEATVRAVGALVVAVTTLGYAISRGMAKRHL